MADSGEVGGKKSTSSRRESAVRASPDESDAMATLTREVSWGYGDDDLAVRSGECASGEEEGGVIAKTYRLRQVTLPALPLSRRSRVRLRPSSVQGHALWTVVKERTHNRTFTHLHR